LTDFQIKALTILRKHGPLTPREFAEKMWPDSPGWERVHKCGPYGASKGAMMPMAGGAYLGKLRKRGLVYWWRNGLLWEINPEGLAALEEATT